MTTHYQLAVVTDNGQYFLTDSLRAARINRYCQQRAGNRAEIRSGDFTHCGTACIQHGDTITVH